MKQNFTPEHILRYLDGVYKKTYDKRLINETARCAILERIREAGLIVGLPFSGLLQQLDFKPNALTIETVESFLAELRSIFWLQNFRFTDIVPLRAKKKVQQPDFTAKYGDKTCVIEIFCLTRKHEQQKDPTLNVYVNFDPSFNGSKFRRDFIATAQNKKLQLDSMQSDIKMLLCVLNSQPMINLNTKTEFDNHAKLLYEKLSWGNGYYLGILTGVEPNGISSDTVFPILD